MLTCAIRAHVKKLNLEISDLKVDFFKSLIFISMQNFYFWVPLHFPLWYKLEIPLKNCFFPCFKYLIFIFQWLYTIYPIACIPKTV
jgi:hypothetical protein